jgi:glycosyltransferase involved in cell wall biosynthesis
MVMTSLMGMNILHINLSSAWRGGEHQTLLLARGLQHYPCAQFLGAVPQGALWRRAREISLATLPLATRTGLSIPAAITVRRHVRRNRTAIVHAHTSHAHTLAVLALSGMPDVRLVVTRRIQQGIGAGPFSRLKYRRADHYVAISAAIAELLLRDGIPEERISRIYSGIELETAKVSRTVSVKGDHALPDNTVVIGTVAALTKEKDIETLVHAARRVVDRHPQAYFAVVGSGPLEHSLRELARTLRVDDHLFFLGFRDDVVPFLNGFDVFALPSRSEGLGTSVLDAMRAGLPIVASRTGGIPEMVDHETNGLLFTPGDANELADSLGRLITDRNARKHFGSRSRTAVRKFDIRATVRDTFELYQTLVDMRGGKPIE